MEPASLGEPAGEPFVGDEDPEEDLRIEAVWNDADVGDFLGDAGGESGFGATIGAILPLFRLGDDDDARGVCFACDCRFADLLLEEEDEEVDGFGSELDLELLLSPKNLFEKNLKRFLAPAKRRLALNCFKFCARLAAAAS